MSLFETIICKPFTACHRKQPFFPDHDLWIIGTVIGTACKKSPWFFCCTS